MKPDNIKNSYSVVKLRALVREHGSQRAVAKALGDENLQSAISNSLAGVRMPSKALMKAMEVYCVETLGKEPDNCGLQSDVRVVRQLSITMHFSKDTKNSLLYRTDAEGAGVKNIYLLKSHIGPRPPDTVEVVVKLPD